MPKGIPHTNLIDKKVGNLTLKKKVGGEKYPYRPSWWCQCVCGEKVLYGQQYLLSDKAVNASCGCHHSLKTNTGSKSKLWTGHGQISGAYFAMIQHSAKVRDISFNITIEEAWEKFEHQNGKCALTNLDIVISESIRAPEYEHTASLGRINSDKDYSVDNIQWVHKDVNRMKNAFSQERFIEICCLVATKLGPVPN